MRSARASLVVLVAPAGVVAGHGLGYLLSGADTPGSHAVDHGYLPIAVSVALPLVVGALLWAAARPGRTGTRHRSQVPLGLLVATQWTLFTGQELVEHAAAGHAAGLLHSRALWFGLGAQVVVAATAALLVSASALVGARAVQVVPPGPPRLVPPLVSTCPTVGARRPPVAVLCSTITSRGPPPRPC